MVLFKATGKARNHKPYLLKLVLTAAGRKLLGHAHPAIKARASVRFKPVSGKAFSAAQTFTLPATS